MFFQPRIFISSLLKEKLETREEIKKILEDCGATVLMYEKNLTPSINNLSRRIRPPYSFRRANTSRLISLQEY